MSARQRTEATGKAFTKITDTAVFWRGRRFKLPPASAVPLEALEAEEDGKYLTVPTLRELRGCLAPSGRLVVVGCYREAGPVDLFAARPASEARALGPSFLSPSRCAATTHDGAHRRSEETLADIRAAAARELPGARIRRRLRRYTLVYDAPSGRGGDSAT
jgi:hypothetical protein